MKKVGPFFYLSIILSISLFSKAQNVPLDHHNARLKNLISLHHQELPVTGKNVLVSVIDTGVSFSIPALRKNLIPGWNFITNDKTMIDNTGHGTPIAGIITIVAPEVKILPLVAMGDTGLRENVVAALIYALKNKASVINLSMSFEEDLLREVRDTVGIQTFNKSLLVLASGNSGLRFTEFRETWNNVIVVGAIGLNHPVKSPIYSVYGPAVDIAAPAGDDGDGITTYDAFSGFPRLFNGTSGAVPVVTGAAALLKEKYPHALGADLKRMLVAGTCHSENINVRHGRLLNIGKLLGTSFKCP